MQLYIVRTLIKHLKESNRKSELFLFVLKTYIYCFIQILHKKFQTVEAFLQSFLKETLLQESFLSKNRTAFFSYLII